MPLSTICAIMSYKFKEVNMAKKEVVIDENQVNYRKTINEKIKNFELEGKFDVDVADNPETKVLEPDQIEYIKKGFFSKLKTSISLKLAIKFYESEIKKGKLIIDDVVGLDNFDEVSDKGAIITCNHFSVYDNYIIHRAIRKKLGKKTLYKVIREGNYTNFPGFYGMLFRNCNTLPLSSNVKTMQKFLKAIDEILKNGDKILIYPEQAMWDNYRKPRPLKIGAFKFASKALAPVLPMFITMQDSDKKGEDGEFIQRHTLHILPPIYPDKNLSVNDNAKMLLEKNFEMWKNIYEETYKTDLTYTTLDQSKVPEICRVKKS